MASRDRDFIVYAILDVLFTDDHGISEEAYNLILEWIRSSNPEYARQFQLKVNATDGRFYYRGT